MRGRMAGMLVPNWSFTGLASVLIAAALLFVGYVSGWKRAWGDASFIEIVIGFLVAWSLLALAILCLGKGLPPSED